MWIKPKKFDRVLDTQRCTYFATGYNDECMNDLIEDFKSYIRGGTDCPEGEEDWTEAEYNQYFDQLFDSWESIAEWLQGCELEESETKFEELD